MRIKWVVISLFVAGMAILALGGWADQAQAADKPGQVEERGLPGMPPMSAPFTGPFPGVHQRGNIPVLEGHEVHKFPIEIAGRLAPGTHKLGQIQIDGIGAVQVAVEVGMDGSVAKIMTQWPKEVRPELVSDTTHQTYAASSGGAISASGKAKCQLIHAGGQCLGCSRLIWIEIIMKASL
jgi:hypothetical protein